MIEVYQWGPGFDQPSFDPFCLSVQAYLNVNGVKWVSNECSNPSISPNGILPVMKTTNGQVITGPDAIIKHLKDRGHDLDADLNPAQRAESLGFITLIQERLYDALLYNWWIEADNFINNTTPTLQTNMSFLSARLLPTKLRERVIARLSSYGTVPLEGGKTGERIPRVYSNARQIFKELADFLGDKRYFFGGSSPSTLDCIAFGHLALHTYPSLKVPTLFSMLIFEFPTLIAYVERLKPQFIQPIVKSPFQTPAFHTLVRAFISNPNSYVLWALSGFKSTLSDQEEQKNEDEKKAARIKRFYNGLSVLGGISFFSLFLQKHCIDLFVKSEEEDLQE